MNPAPVSGPGSGAGFSLVELLVSMGLGTMVLATGVALVLGHARWTFQLRQEAHALAGLHWAIEQTAADLYSAGIDPQGIHPLDPLEISRDAFSRAADLDGDGRVDTRSAESVSVLLSPQGDLIRQVGRQRMALLSGVAPGGFSLQTFDRFGERREPAASAEPTGSLMPPSTLDAEVARVLFRIDTLRGGRLTSSVALRWVARRENATLP